jgi:hypothetical protein
VTLADIARVIGGEIRGDTLATRIRGQHAYVTRVLGPLTHDERYHLAVVASERMEWNTDLLPQLRDGYVFTGYRDSAVTAAARRQTSIEEIVATLDDLAQLATEGAPVMGWVRYRIGSRPRRRFWRWKAASLWWRLRSWLAHRRGSLLVALLVFVLLLG